MKTLRISLLFFFLLTGFTLNALGQDFRDHHPKNGDRNSHRGGKGGGSYSAPLDGGLLTVLGAAGVAYYVARRKKRETGD